MGAESASADIPMEARIARLESDVAHLRTDVADIKLDVRSLRDKVDSLKDSIAGAKVWALLLYIALAAVNLGTLARGFGWI
jgi:outer membrane murein-binding lipoprotein Lpp